MSLANSPKSKDSVCIRCYALNFYLSSTRVSAWRRSWTSSSMLFSSRRRWSTLLEMKQPPRTHGVRTCSLYSCDTTQSIILRSTAKNSCLPKRCCQTLKELDAPPSTPPTAAQLSTTTAWCGLFTGRYEAIVDTSWLTIQSISRIKFPSECLSRRLWRTSIPCWQLVNLTLLWSWHHLKSWTPKSNANFFSDWLGTSLLSTRSHQWYRRRRNCKLKSSSSKISALSKLFFSTLLL